MALLLLGCPADRIDQCRQNGELYGADDGAACGTSSAPWLYTEHLEADCADAFEEGYLTGYAGAREVSCATGGTSMWGGAGGDAVARSEPGPALHVFRSF